MNKQEINKAFFEDLHEIQINKINTDKYLKPHTVIDDARKVMLKLILYINTTDKGINAEKDEAVLDALKWIKNNVS